MALKEPWFLCCDVVLAFFSDLGFKDFPVQVDQQHLQLLSSPFADYPARKYPRNRLICPDQVPDRISHNAPQFDMRPI